VSGALRVILTRSLLIGGAFGTGWLALPAREVPPAIVQARQDAWALEGLPRRADQTMWAAKAVSAGYWGMAPAPAAEVQRPAEDLGWRVAAIFGAGSDRKLLVSFKNPSTPPRMVKVGEKLPSGHLVTQIGEREYCVRLGDGVYRLGVERIDQ
jgi:hypothetical protein